MNLPDNYAELDDNEIIKRIQNGENELFSVVSKRYTSLISYFISSFNCSKEDREDLMQEGLLALYYAVGVYDFISSSFCTFASVCIRRGLISSIRRISRKKLLPQIELPDIENIPVGDFNPEEVFINKENFIHFLDKIKLSLSSFEYSVLTSYLRYTNYGDVAENLSVSVKKVDNALQRVRKKISKINR